MASEAGAQNPPVVSKQGIMTFHPTREEFQNFSRYIAYMESQGAHKAGLAKIIPPDDWTPRKGGYEDIDDLVIPAPIQQVVTGQSGLFTQYNIQKKPMTVREFRKMANCDKFCTPRSADFEELDRKYWKNVTFNPPIYGADVNGTLYDKNVTEWNIGRLNTILDTVESEKGITIEGVNTPYLYFGMWKTTFAWHTEDMDLYSINYLHFGEPKSWYAIPPEHGKRLERLAQGFFPGSSQSCEAFLRHKMTLISPSILRKYGIPFEKITQTAGQFIVTFPYGYHAGFNHGFNCAESTNFATQRWIDYGKRAVLCSCRKDMVKISMDVFVKKFQPERYERWLAGRDLGAPIDHSRPTPESQEFLQAGRDTAGPIDHSRPAPESQELLLRPNTSGDVPCSPETCPEEASAEWGRRSPTRISTKRHRVCPDVPENVVPKDHDDKEVEEEKEEYGKKARLGTETDRKMKVPPVVIVMPARFTLPSASVNPPHHPLGSAYASCSSLLIRSQELLRNGHMSVSAAPSRIAAAPTTQAAPTIQAAATLPKSPSKPGSKPGVTSLLFHKTLSPTKALQAHSYARVPQPDHQKQLNMHSYAWDHQPLHLQQHKAQNQTRVQNQAQNKVQNHAQTHNQTQPPNQAQNQAHVQIICSPVRTAQQVSIVAKVCLGDVEQHNQAKAKTTGGNGGEQDQSGTWVQGLGTGGQQASEPQATGGKPKASQASKGPRPVQPPAAIIHIKGQKKQSLVPLRLSVPKIGQQIAAVDVGQSYCKTVRNQQGAVVGQSYCKTVKNRQGAVVGQSYCKTVKNGQETEVVQSDQTVKSHPLLRNLPRTHPLLNPEPVTHLEVRMPEEEEEWSRPLTQLWQSQPYDSEAERDYNRLMGKQSPYCSICMLFHTHQEAEGPEVKLLGRRGGRQRSKPLIPELCFSNWSKKAEEQQDDKGELTTSRLDPDGNSLLVSCSQCCVRVHTSCYGVSEEVELDDWLCARCEAKAMDKDCCLCFLRGGALKKANNDKWVHVLCAVSVREARFVNIAERGPVDLSGIPVSRFRLKCVLCKHLRLKNEVVGCLVQCSHGHCSTAFHPTCAQAAGVLMYPDDWPLLVFITCRRHQLQTFSERDEASLRQLEVGQRVICKHKNGRYYHSEVVHLDTETNYEVLFDDGSYSDNLLPEDIETRDCLQLGPPAKGEEVQVRWTDGLLYGAKFKESHSIIMYQVEFEDGSVRNEKRNKIYSLEDNLPKSIKAKMSVASEMRFDGIFEEKDVEQDSKRQRVINSRYQKDYVEPVLY